MLLNTVLHHGAKLVAAFALYPILTIAAPAQTYTILHTFDGGADGSQLPGRLILDGKGHLWGTTFDGGGTNCGNKEAAPGCGDIFEMDLSGNETVMYRFTGGTDGEHPAGGLIFDPSGNVYGVTNGGGDPTCLCGTVYELDTTGKLTVLHTFQNPGDWASSGSLYRDPVGNIYGATSIGGLYGVGVIYRISPNLTETVLHRFGCASSPCNDGAGGRSDLISDSPGVFYGTTGSGGGNGENGGGTVYKLVLPKDETVLHSFPQSNEDTDGSFPRGDLVHDAAGNLYGVTGGGGSTACNGTGCGTIFEIAPDGAETILYRFTGQADGSGPTWLVIDKDGNLYGVADAGGTGSCTNGCGTIFKFDTAGNFTVLYQFASYSEGVGPGSLIRDPAGNLYGTAATKTNDNQYFGIVFKLAP